MQRPIWPRRISGRVQTPRSRSFLSVLPASRRRTSSSGRVRSRFHSRAFMERSRWPSTRSMEGPGARDEELGAKPQVFQCFDDGVVVAFDFNGAPDLVDVAVGVDEEGGADDAHFLFAVHVLFAPSAELLGDLVLGVGEERKIELELALEFGVAGDVVGADAEDFCAELFQLSRAVAKG